MKTTVLVTLGVATGSFLELYHGANNSSAKQSVGAIDHAGIFGPNSGARPRIFHSQD
jgi:hypothetical protein